MKQLRQIIQGDVSFSFMSQKKLQKCTSATEIATMRLKKAQRFSQFNDGITLFGGKDRKSQQMDQFLFCLKLKMIGVFRLFENQEIDSEKISSQDANQILNQLTKKIKNYQKQTSKRLNEQMNKNKAIQIKVINLEAYIRSLQSDLQLSKKQAQKNSKIHQIDLKKIQNKIKQQESQKQNAEFKLRSSNQIVDEQLKIISQLEVKVNQLIKIKKSMQTVIFERQKQFTKLVNEQKLSRMKFQHDIQNFKKSLMKKAEETNKLSAQVKNMKQVIELKELKIDEIRRKNNKLYSDLQKSQSNLRNITQECSNIKKIMKVMSEEYEKQAVNLKQQQLGITKTVNELEVKLNSKMENIKTIIERIDQVRIYQHHIQTEIHWLGRHMDQLIKGLQKRYQSQQILLKQQFEIQIKQVVMNVQQFFQNKIAELQDQIYYLQKNECKHILN